MYFKNCEMSVERTLILNACTWLEIISQKFRRNDKWDKAVLDVTAV